MSGNNTHLPFLDHIRGIAIGLVFVFHCLSASFGFDQLPWLGWVRNFNVDWSFLILFPATYGWAGVAIFFAVSGFCIHLSHERSQMKNMLDFFTRRFFRIYPPYLAALLIFCFWHPVGSPNYHELLSYDGIGSHLLLAQNFGLKSFFAINRSFWSIAIEFQLYLLYPLMLLLVRRLGWYRTLFIIGAIEITLRTCNGLSDAFYSQPLPLFLVGGPFYYWFSWCIGAAAADSFLKQREFPLARFPVILFPILTILTSLVKPLVPFSFLFASLSTVSLIGLLIRNPLREQAAIPRWILVHLNWVGLISYSLYLLHQPIVYAFSHVVKRVYPASELHPTALFFVCLLWWVPILLVSWVFYRMIEQPSIAVGKVIIAWRKATFKVPQPI